MYTQKVVGIIILIMFISACAQTPTKDSATDLAKNAKTETVATAKNISNSAGKLAVIDEIMVESGINDTIEQLPELVAMGFDQQPPPPIDNNKRKKFREHLIQAHDPARIKNTIKDYLITHYEQERFTKFLAFLKTPLAQKMTALEKEAQTPVAQQELMQRGNIIMGQATPERLDLVQQLEEVLKATESGINAQMMMTAVIMTNLNKIVPVAQQMTNEQLKQNLEQVRAQSIYPFRQYMILNLVYAYRSVTDDELKQYLALYKTDLGQWSIDLANNALTNASEGIADDLATRLEKDFVVSNAL